MCSSFKAASTVIAVLSTIPVRVASADRLVSKVKLIRKLFEKCNGARTIEWTINNVCRK
jgi:hypothetical protein